MLTLPEHELVPHVKHVLLTLPEHTSKSLMWSRYCLPFRNTRVSRTCGAGTVYPTGAYDLVPHVEQVLHALPKRTS